jgi:hypothetical protein
MFKTGQCLVVKDGEQCKLPGQQKLEATADKAHGIIFELVGERTADLLDSVYYIDWAPSDFSTEQHAHVNDLISYLQVTFMEHIKHLPLTVRESIHFTSCSQIHSSLMAALISTGSGKKSDTHHVKKVNVLGLKIWQEDLDAIMTFADGCGVSQLIECFTPLSQLLKLLLSVDMEKIGELSFREGTYPRINVRQLEAVLLKYKELGVMSTSKRKATDAGLPLLKKKTVDALLKAIKNQD